MKKYAALFSGQGSQYSGMGKELCENFPQAGAVYECAGDILGFDVKKTSFEGETKQISRTLLAQPLIFTLSVAAATAARECLPEPSAVAGHSLGELAALWKAGAYSMEDGFRIVKARAEAMDGASAPGAMYAVMGGDAQEVRAACEAVDGFVVPVNFNLPNQTVVSGDEAAAAEVAANLESAGKRVAKLSVCSAFHTQRMAEAAQRFCEALGSVAFHPVSLDFYSNLTGGKQEIADYPSYFAAHMVSPVRFAEQIASMRADGVEVCVEFGPKNTASTLAKKNARALQVGNVEDQQSLEKAAALFA